MIFVTNQTMTPRSLLMSIFLMETTREGIIRKELSTSADSCTQMHHHRPNLKLCHPLPYSSSLSTSLTPLQALKRIMLYVHLTPTATDPVPHDNAQVVNRICMVIFFIQMSMNSKQLIKLNRYGAFTKGCRRIAQIVALHKCRRQPYV